MATGGTINNSSNTANNRGYDIRKKKNNNLFVRLNPDYWLIGRKGLMGLYFVSVFILHAWKHEQTS